MFEFLIYAAIFSVIGTAIALLLAAINRGNPDVTGEDGL